MIRLACLVVASVLLVAAVQGEGNVPAPPSPPPAGPEASDVENIRDYVFWNSKSRVKDLADSFDAKKKVATIGLSESAVLLEELVRDKPIEDRCERYVQMFQSANTRTTDKMKKLARRIYKDLQQPEEAKTDLSAKFKYELEFGALNKLRILQAAFDNQFNEFTSRKAQPVRNDLFNCIAYFMTRHRDSADGIKEFVNDQIDKILPLVYEPKSPLLYIQESMDNLEKIEKDVELDWVMKKGLWLDEAKKLYALMANNRYNLTPEMMQFVNTEHRMQLFTYMQTIYDRIDYLRNKLVELESLGKNRRGKSRESYRQVLLEIFQKIVANVDWLPNRTISFVHQPERWRLMRSTVNKFRGLTPFEFQATANEQEASAMVALRKSCPVMSQIFKQAFVNLKFDDKFTAEKAQWILHKLHHSLLGCQGLEVDKSHPNSRAWQIYSMTLKLSEWAIKRRENPNIDEVERDAVTDILYKLP